MSKHTRILALLLALVMVFTLAACGSDPEPVDDIPDETDPTDTTTTIFINTLGDDQSSRFPSYVNLIGDYYELNDDTVGWLSIPGTHIDDIVVCNDDPNDLNEFYYRRNFEKEYSFNGVFYADFRNTFGDGKAEELSYNTVIYGHTMSADWDGVMFAPLSYFQDEDFARETPYIYFSTRGEDLVWEVFNVMYVTTDLPYNRPDLSDEEWAKILDESVQRSIYNYDTEVTAEDKILTLSTCTYSVPGIGPVSYPNVYRYVVMAKLVNRRTADKTEASFTVNPSPKAP